MIDGAQDDWGKPWKYLLAFCGLLGLLSAYPSVAREICWLDGDRLRFQTLSGPLEISVHDVVTVETEGREGFATGSRGSRP